MARTPQPRKEATSVRLEPKVKYLVEVAARIQRRSVTNYIEWALEESLKSVDLFEDSQQSVADYADKLWQIEESRRFVILAITRKDLLSFEEQKLWELIIKYPYLYLKKCPGAWTDENINYKQIENDWELLNLAINGDTEASRELSDHHDAMIYDQDLEKQQTDQKLKEFMDTLKTPVTKEDYDRQIKELNNFIADLFNIEK
ncbi:hypothetical protein MMG00_13990 [Ignatzschineria rhizosphaerae]|uniref:Uncharacterized protein n=1 Tax=Ignatzschineria rhizosphaerae TaxID=2923279 RepID=A0ABY3X075_9GAMM|nr:hypothetical protein [Ignatzschineria rhizosphaerae]UNM96282.1 hypothetical protein MMG00_13990 [Ignatzschineria rhizosphaerae]